MNTVVGTYVTANVSLIPPRSEQLVCSSLRVLALPRASGRRSRGWGAVGPVVDVGLVACPEGFLEESAESADSGREGARLGPGGSWGAPSPRAVRSWPGWRRGPLFLWLYVAGGRAVGNIAAK